MAITIEKNVEEMGGGENSGVDIGASLGRDPVTGLSPRTGVHLCPCANNRLGVAHGKYEIGTELR